MSPEHKDLLQSSYLEGRYANAFQVGHNAFEFLLDLGQVAPESEQTHFHTRIITSPVYAKALAETLRESIHQYEQAFGTIPKERES
jgi:hypothetical protein